MASASEQQAKSRLMAKARKISRDVERYHAFGYVTQIDDYEADDRKLLRAIDGLYDSARKAGIGEDQELQDYRTQLRAAYVTARNAGHEARQAVWKGRADAIGRPEVPAGMRGYLDELSLGEAKRRAKSRR
jgi:hypothetical protein